VPGPVLSIITVADSVAAEVEAEGVVVPLREWKEAVIPTAVAAITAGAVVAPIQVKHQLPTTMEIVPNQHHLQPPHHLPWKAKNKMNATSSENASYTSAFP